jgi:O-antigen ligase
VLRREPVAVGLAVVLLALVLLPRNGAALTGLIAACGLAVWLVIARGADADVDLRRSIPGIAALAGPPAIIVLCAVLAVNPAVALSGTVMQRTGAALWVAVSALALAAGFTARPGDTGRSVRSIAVFSAALGVSVLLEAVGVFRVQRAPGPPAGFMENALSAGQLMAVGVLCAVGWAAGSKTLGERLCAGVAAVVSLAGLAFADSAGAWVGLGAGVSAAVVVWLLAHSGRLKPVVVAAGLAAGLIVVTGALWLTFGDTATGPLEQRLSGVANARFETWESAIASVRSAPLMGHGPDQFSAFIAWESDPGSTFEPVGTSDPHNLLLYLLTSSGAVGLAAALGAIFVISHRVLRPLERRPSWALAAVAGALAAWLAASMLVWVGPLALALVALLLGPFMLERRGAAAGEGDPVRVLRPAAAVAMVAAGTALAIASTGASHEYRWTRALDTGEPVSPMAIQAARATQDPTYVLRAALDVLFAAQDDPSGATRALEELAPVEPLVERDSAWQVDLALVRYQLAAVRIASQGAVSWDEAARALQAGKRADPRSGLWDYNGAVQAEALGFRSEALEYAKAALGHELPANVRAYLMARIAELEE